VYDNAKTFEEMLTSSKDVPQDFVSANEPPAH
jgi:hypothetical protein